MSKPRLSIYIWAIIFIGIAVYFNSLFNGFAWDDEEQILNNAAVHSVTNILTFFLGSTFNTGGTGILAGVYYRPIMMVVFSLLYAVAGPHALLFHLVQTLLHIAVAIMIFRFFMTFFGRGVSFFLSLVFLVHPMNVESVSYVAAIQDVMLVFFSITTFFVGMHPWKEKGALQSLVIGILFLLALLSKEVALLSICIFIAYQALYHRRRAALYALVLMLVVGIYCFMRFALAGVYFTAFHFAPIVNLPFLQRVSMSPLILLYYVSTFLWPAKLSVMQHWVVRGLPFMYIILPAIAVFVFSGGLAALLWKTKSKTLLFFSIWFAVGISPYLQLFPLDMTVAERWFYFPMIGLLGMAGWFVETAYARTAAGGKNIYIAAAAIIVTAFGIRTVVRNADWRNDLTLFGHDIQISRNAFDLENNYGVALFRNERYDESIVHFRRSTELAGGWWINWNNLGAAYQRKGDLDTAARYYKKSLENGDYYLAYENYASTLILQQKYDEARMFLEQKAMRIFPYNETLRQYHQYLLEQQESP